MLNPFNHACVIYYAFRRVLCMCMYLSDVVVFRKKMNFVTLGNIVITSIHHNFHMCITLDSFFCMKNDFYETQNMPLSHFYFDCTIIYTQKKNSIKWLLRILFSIETCAFWDMNHAEMY